MSIRIRLVKHQLLLKRLPGAPVFVGLLLFTAMTLTVGEIAEDVRNGEPLTVLDTQLSNWLHVHRTTQITRALWLFTSLHSTIAVTCAAVVLGFYLLWRRQPYWFTAMLLSVFGGMGLNKLLKFAFHRARPRFDDPILALNSYSFPSGHTMMATVLYGVLAAYLVSKIPTWRWRALIVAVSACLILLVGFSRIYLGAHYLSDVMAAIAEGLAWLSLCLTIVYSVWRHRESS